VSKPPTPKKSPTRGFRPSALTLTTIGLIAALGAGVTYLALTHRGEPVTPVVIAVSAPAQPAPTSVAPEPPAVTEPPPQVAAAPALPILADTPVRPPPTPLPPAPDPALVVGSPLGPLPVIAPDGRQAWKVYARPLADGPRRPRIAILLTGLGLSEPQTQAAVQLPGEITLGFLPHAQGLPVKVADARAAGHEVLLQVPMEPRNYPNDDPGPHALLTSVTASANLERLDWSLSRAVGYVGVINRRGARFAESGGDLRPVLESLRNRGLMYLDASEAQTDAPIRLADQLGVPRVTVDRRIDQEASRGAIDGKLIELEVLARRAGQAVGLGEPFPVTIERLGGWAAGLADKGIDLVPISAMPPPVAPAVAPTVPATPPSLPSVAPPPPPPPPKGGSH